MSQWITDRLPTETDGLGSEEIVWIWRKPMYCEGPADIFICKYWNVKEGTPWAPMLPPEPYAKPSRYVVEEIGCGYWRVRDTKTGVLNNAAFNNEDLAQRLADFFNEVMP